MRLDLSPKEARRIFNSRANAQRKAQTKAAPKLAKRENSKATRGRELDKGYLAHTRRQPCILAGKADPCQGRVEATHLRYGNAAYGRLNPGMSRKPDDKWVLPACSHHHRAQHAAGNEPRWWASWGIDPDAECVRRYAEFIGGHHGE